MYCSFSHQSDAIALALRMERDVQSRKDLDQRSDGSVELLVRVGRHQREANERITRSDSRGYHWIDEDPFLEEHCRHTEGLLVVTDEERNNRSRSIAYLEAELTEVIQAVSSLLLQGLNALRLA